MTTTAEPGTELIRSPEQQAISGLEAVERIFTQERREQICAYLAISPDDPALIPYLAASASYGLDPMMGDIWLIPKRIKVRDGNATVWKDAYAPAIGRDGLLRIARGRKEYVGYQAQAVCERDVFEVKWTGDPLKDPIILHQFASKPTAFKPGEDAVAYRGRVIGAWCKLFLRDGRPPFFYYANIKEHQKTKVNEHTGQREWDGAWSYTSPMVMKSAIAYCHRVGLGITGFVPVDELRDEADASRASALVEDAPPAAEFDWKTVPEEVRDQLREAVAESNELAPFSWTAAKCEMVLKGQPTERLEMIAERIAAENETLRERAAAAPAEAKPEDEEPVDADVVGETPEAEEGVDTSVLQHRAAELEGQLAGQEPGSVAFDELSAELDQVQDQIRLAGGGADGQTSLDDDS